MKKVFSLLVLVTASFGTMMSAHADAIVVVIDENLTLVQSSTQQSEQGPCVIGDNSCDGSLGYTLIQGGGNVTEYEGVFSPNYTVAFFTNLVGTAFSIGIDVNTASGQDGAEANLLAAFVMLVNGTQVFAWDTPTVLDPLINNGNGFSDWQLDGFDLTGLNDEDIISFGVNMYNVSPGTEQFFTIVAAGEPCDDCVSVPEPGTIGLLGLGLLGLGLTRRRKQV